MSSSERIGAPFTLATLSKPVGSTNGRAHAASVCSISGIKKRKRTEVAVGLDGEGVSIYSLQNPQLVTSYALPPTTTFALAPLSVYRKSSSRGPSQRFTYVCVSGTTQADKPQLLCFHEKTSADSTETVKTAYTPSESASIIALDALPVTSSGSSSGTTHDVLATFEDGNVTCLSADLDTVRWVAKLDTTQVGLSIENVSTTTAKAVTRGLLRSREDIASVLNPTADDASELQELTQVLCIIGRNPTGNAIVSLIQIQPRAQDLNTSPLSPLKHLVSWDLHSSAKLPKGSDLPARYALHASSGTLHILTGASLASYDLSGSVPRLYSECNIPGDNVDSFLRVAQDVLFTTSQQTCRVFDTKFNSLQAIHSLVNTGASEAASPAKKRKLNQSESEHRNGHVQLLAYYPEHDLVVAVRDNEILGMQLNLSSTQKRARHESTLLCDALGKGTPLINARETKKWQEEKATCDRYASKGKVKRFERTLAANLGIPIEGKRAQQLSRMKINELNGGPMTNGVGPSIPKEDAMALDLDEDESEREESPNDNAKGNLRRWNPPSLVPDGRKVQYRQYASYALQKIFLMMESTENDLDPQIRLKIDFFPPNVFQWLLQIGQINAASVRHALLEESPEDAERLSSIIDGDIVKALVDFDPDMQILSAILNDSGHLPVGEVVQAIKLLMQSINEQPDTDDTTKMLTNGTTAPEDDMDVDITSELDAATEEINHALSVLDHGLDSRSHALRPALIRLHSFAPRSITSTLRSMLPRRELESLIGVLHLEMKNGGWSLDIHDNSIIGAPVMESSTEGPDDHAVAIIASLLSCALDAIGTGAWLANVGTSADTEIGEDLIGSLQEDTSSALNGFWEARYMRGLLGEFLRYASQLSKSHKASSTTMERKGKPFRVIQQDGELPMLPLGAKPDMGVEKMKAGRGSKKEERSKREIGMMISKKVPKYSFERIVL
ncbi:hypothetical protein DE146DRAFT_668185 [Phaeosphaeria sp. MPI-PUGE-AT-0046c]|nr:hypothetical protein DE146DRAFT_668185 [Phaeosphaeria sp. MPI-PUGE-AT-0046c]